MSMIGTRHLRARKELTIVSRMPLHILHPRCVVIVRSHNSIFLVHASVKHFDTTVRKAGQERIDGPIVRDHGSYWTVRIGLEVLNRSIAA